MTCAEIENEKPVNMGESFQDYSWIQDFEADFRKKFWILRLTFQRNSGFWGWLSKEIKDFLGWLL